MSTRTVLVTGGAGGLGSALARHFRADGDNVVIADVDDEAGERIAAETGCVYVHTDVSVFADNQAAVATAVERFGGLDAVCLNAGVPGGGGVGADFDPGRYRHGIGINLDGIVYGANAALPELRKRGRGTILITSSIAGVAPSPDLYYSTAKHGLIGLTRSLAMVLHAEPITVNAICPGFVDTPIIAGAREALITNGIALAAPEDIAAEAATIMASDESGTAWEVQAGRPALRIEFRPVDLPRTTP